MFHERLESILHLREGLAGFHAGVLIAVGPLHGRVRHEAAPRILIGVGTRPFQKMPDGPVGGIKLLQEVVEHLSVLLAVVVEGPQIQFLLAPERVVETRAA